MSIDSIEDESNWFNIGLYELEQFMNIKLDKNEFSSYVQYPHHYKFFSVDFLINRDIKHFDRTSYDVLNLLSDVGGIQQILLVFFSAASAKFALVKT